MRWTCALHRSSQSLYAHASHTLAALLVFDPLLGSTDLHALTVNLIFTSFCILCHCALPAHDSAFPRTLTSCFTLFLWQLRPWTRQKQLPREWHWELVLLSPHWTLVSNPFRYDSCFPYDSRTHLHNTHPPTHTHICEVSVSLDSASNH